METDVLITVGEAETRLQTKTVRPESTLRGHRIYRPQAKSLTNLNLKT